MIIYKYVRPDGINIIKDLRIKASNPRDFNDPFEFLPTIIDISAEQADVEVFNNESYLRRLHSYALSENKTNKPYELYLQEIMSKNGREQILKNFANISKALRITCKKLRAESSQVALMVCFCGNSIENQEEILMWSHYTDGHKGLRLAFNTDYLNIPGSSFIKINYELNRIQLNPIDHFRKGFIFKDVFDRLIETKCAIWSYEKEYRWMVQSKQCQNERGDWFVPINPKAIIEVICGAHCSLETVSLIKKLVFDNLGDEVKVKKAELDNYKFKLNYIEV